MKLFIKGCYVMVVLVDLVIVKNEDLILLVEILKWQDILLFYFEQFFVWLCWLGLVELVCGLGGGYCLVKVFEMICVVDIFEVVDEIVSVLYVGVGVLGGIFGFCV